MNWQPIETVPENRLVHVLEAPSSIYPDGRELLDKCVDGIWVRHTLVFESYCAIVQEGMEGPSQHPKYTHWCKRELKSKRDTTNAI